MRETSYSWLGVLAASTMTACSAPPPPGAELTRSGGAAIVNGTPADAYPEAAIINIYKGASVMYGCSGSLIGPSVALTAGHCVYSWDGWDVLVPYNGNQVHHASMGMVNDWSDSSGGINSTQHDIGLIFLDKPAYIPGPACPKLAQMPVADNTNVVNIGRVVNMQVSFNYLFVSAPTPVTASGSYPFDYDAADYIQMGDSGGPDEVPNTSPHQIVAVNSGSDGGGPMSGSEELARVDLLYDWIKQQVDGHGGFCDPNAPADAGGGGGDSSGGSDAATGDAGSSSSSGSSSGGGVPDSGGSSSSGGGSGGSGAGGADGGTSPVSQSSGCAVSSGGASPEAFALFGLLALAAGTRSRRSPLTSGRAGRRPG